jgi:hypothetical protein
MSSSPRRPTVQHIELSAILPCGVAATKTSPLQDAFALSSQLPRGTPSPSPRNPSSVQIHQTAMLCNRHHHPLVQSPSTLTSQYTMTGWTKMAASQSLVYPSFQNWKLCTVPQPLKTRTPTPTWNLPTQVHLCRPSVLFPGDLVSSPSH